MVRTEIRNLCMKCFPFAKNSWRLFYDKGYETSIKSIKTRTADIINLSSPISLLPFRNGVTSTIKKQGEENVTYPLHEQLFYQSSKNTDPEYHNEGDNVSKKRIFKMKQEPLYEYPRTFYFPMVFPQRLYHFEI